jgi:hypothetical protein
MISLGPRINGLDPKFCDSFFLHDCSDLMASLSSTAGSAKEQEEAEEGQCTSLSLDHPDMQLSKL